MLVTSLIAAEMASTVALYVSVVAGSVVLLVVALHAYASWSIRNIDRNVEQ